MKSKMTKEYLQTLYVNLELNTKKIAEIFNCTRETVLVHLKKHGIPIRKLVAKPITIPELDINLAYFYGMLQGNGYVHLPKEGQVGPSVVGVSCKKKPRISSTNHRPH